MDFRTVISVPPLKAKVDYSHEGVMLGSCFAENIAERMLRVKLPVAKNPFGVLYNPASIARAIEYLAAGREFSAEDLQTDGELWFSFAHHGSFSSPDADVALDAMNMAARQGVRALQQAGYAVITLGTAWVYELAGGGGVVANCHKLPASRFVRRRMTVDEIVETLGGAIGKHLANKDIILTVSPVRHLKDGLVENSLSKAILIEACHAIAALNQRVEYFPSYEIMVDELRDYRFYAPDMLHPSAQAVDYIWERFCTASMDAATLSLMREVEQIADAASHRPLHPDAPSYKRFCATMLSRAAALQKAHPEIDLGGEIKYFSAT